MSLKVTDNKVDELSPGEDKLLYLIHKLLTYSREGLNFSLILKLILEYSDYEYAELWITNFDKNCLELRSQKHIEGVEKVDFYNLMNDDFNISFSLDEGLPGLALSSKDIQFIDIQGNNFFQRRDLALQENLRYALTVPFTSQIKCNGLLLLMRSKEHGKTIALKSTLQKIAYQIFSKLELTEVHQEAYKRFNLFQGVICVVRIRDLMIKEVNNSFKRYLGAGNYVGETFFEVFDQSEFGLVVENLNHMDSFHLKFKNTLETRLGPKAFYWEVNFYEEEGVFIAFGDDISELQKAENTLSETQRIAKIGTWEYDVLEERLILSDITKDIFNADCKKKYLTLEDMLDFFKAGKNRDKIKKRIIQTLNNKVEVSWTKELVIEHTDEHEKWISMHGESIIEDGKCIAIHGYIQDIDRIKQTESLLIDTYKDKEKILDTITDAFIRVDPEGIVLYANSTAENLFGLQNSILGNNIYLLLDLKGNDSLKKTLETTKGSSENKSLKYFSARLNLWVDVIIYASKIGISIILRDITNVIKNEIKIRENYIKSLTSQSKLLSAQLNPHFMFNILSSIQYYVLDNQTMEALNFIDEFAKLMRATLENSKLEFISVKEEIDFLDTYLRLERIRFNDRFEYSFQVDDSVDVEQVMLPPMLIQPYLENSIKHGLSNIDGKGQIELSFIIKDECLICEVRDNGIGIQKSMENKSFLEGSNDKIKKTSMGLRITSDRFDVLSEIYNADFECEVLDLQEIKGQDSDVSGTVVRLKIPLVEED